MLQVSEISRLVNLEKVTRDITVASGISKEINALLLDIDLEISHRSDFLPRVRGLLREIDNVKQVFIGSGLIEAKEAVSDSRNVHIL